MKSESLSLKTKLRRSPNALIRDFENESVLLLTDKGIYFGLNDIGTRVWHLLDRHDSLQPVLKILEKEYQVSQARLTQDLLSLAQDLMKEGLIQHKAQEETCGRI